MATREDNVYMAKLSEQAERYDEMVEAVCIMCVSVFQTNFPKIFFDINMVFL